MPAKAAAKAKKFLVLKGVDGRTAVSLDSISKVSFVRPSVAGLLEDREYLRLYLAGYYVDVADEADQDQVLGALGITDLAQEEVAAL